MNNEINGVGEEYEFNRLKFEGEYLNGKRNGIGNEYDILEDKLIFEGEYLSDIKWNGKGYDLFNNIVYEIKNGKGIIKEYYNYNILNFESEFLYGERNGKGKEYDSKGRLIFEDEYLNGKKHGKGKGYDLNGKLKFEGEYLYDCKYKGKFFF